MQLFQQRLVARTDDVIVTLLEEAGVPEPMRVDGRLVLAPRSPIVWLTFPGAWHDIGRFHDEAGRPTGFYANVLRPVELGDGSSWETTDLFLDVWCGNDGVVRLLDEDELSAAAAAGAVDRATEARARAEAARLLGAARRGAWPPRVAHEWTLARARAVLAERGDVASKQ